MNNVAQRVAIFHAAFGVETGWGHAARCSALARELSDCGWKTIFLAQPEIIDFLSQSLPKAVETAILGTAIDDPEAISVLTTRWPDGCDLIVLDDYDLRVETESAVRDWARKCLVLEDILGRRHDCDLVIDPTPGRTRADYGDLLPARCALFAGAHHVLLRQPFSEAKRRVVEPPRVLVSLGATDPSNATAKVIKALDGFALEIVLSDLAPHLQVVQECAAAHSSGARVHVNVGADFLADLMGCCTLAVGAGGQGAWERCAVGLPSVLFETASNQGDIIRALLECGAAVSTDSLAGTVKRLLRDVDSRNGMSAAGRSLCDGLGARRVARLISGLDVSSGGRVTLQPAAPDDADRMLEWQQHPQTRRFANRQELPSATEHETWFAARMGDPETQLYMIELDGFQVGVLRLDPETTDTWRISIYIAPDRHGRGIGGAALALAHGAWPGHAFTAEVLTENHASHKLFERSGYTVEEGVYRRRADQSAHFEMNAQ